MTAESSKPSDLSVLSKYLQDEDLSQECQELIATLPMESGWMTTSLHQYQGFWYSPRQLQATLNCQNHFQAHDSDILLVTSPKSGTTWLKALVFSILNRKSHKPKSSVDSTQTHPLLTAHPHDLVPSLVYRLYVRERNPDLSSFSPPRLFACHLPYVSLPMSVKQSRCKIVYLSREPKDLFVSLWHYANKLRQESFGLISIEDSFDMFCRGVSPYGPFWDHMLEYYKKSLEMPEKILFLSFEQLKGEPERVLKDVAEFIGCAFSEDEESGNVIGDILRLCSFENLSNMEVNKSGKTSTGKENKAFFRRGEVGDWKNFLTFDMTKRLNGITREKLEKHGLKF